jgi:osmotically-inducible protein OsmY
MILKTRAATAALAVAVVMATACVAAQAQSPLSSSDSAQTTQDRGGDMASRVKRTLHADPALNDKHIDVSMQNGKVVMTGFVLTSTDMVKAIRAAGKAAGPKNVVNKLTVNSSDEVNSDNSNG